MNASFVTRTCNLQLATMLEDLHVYEQMKIEEAFLYVTRDGLIHYRSFICRAEVWYISKPVKERPFDSN